jgi:predicted ATPase
MKINYLKIGRFKNLHKFELNLKDNPHDILVTIGKNGTGKSNLLEALVLIFRDLVMEENKPPFEYELHYNCRNTDISVVADPNSKTKYQFSIEREKLKRKELFWSKDDVGFLYLPEYIFAYYSGISNRLEEHFDSSQKKFYNDLKNGVDRAFRPLFYARPIHSNFVLLAFYAFEDTNIKDFLEQYLQITGFHSSLFVVTKPNWNSKEGDIRFWKAKGIVAGFLDKLFSKCLAPIKDEVEVRVDFRHSETKECWYLFLESQQKLQELAQEYGSNVDFFKALESTYISELIHETRIRVEKKNPVDGAITFKELSEGEQQLLTVLGLLKFTNHAESLFLLDEPDTHLSPIWGHEYLKILKRISGEYGKSQMFLSTHKPTTISGLSRDQIIIFEKEQNEQIHAGISPISPKGLSSDGILTQIFEMEYTYDEATYNDMIERRRLVAKKMFEPENLTSQEDHELVRLTTELSDYSENYADGLFYEFIYELDKTGGLASYRGIDLTENEKANRRKKAEELLEKLKQKRINKMQ